MDAKFGLYNRLYKNEEKFVNSETYMDQLLKIEFREPRLKISKVKRHENRESNICLLIGVSEMNERKNVEEIFDVTVVEIFPDMMRHRGTSISLNQY